MGLKSDRSVGEASVQFLPNSDTYKIEKPRCPANCAQVMMIMITRKRDRRADH